MYYLAMDGGGTKLIGLLFDDRYRMVAWARTEGTHTSVYPEKEVRAHITACYEHLFEDLPRPLHIEMLYGVGGDTDLYARLLPPDITIGGMRPLSEGISALYAGSYRHSGFVALAGTGSDVFCVQDDRITEVIGGWGAILGDEGSGVWMARQAMQVAIRAEEGWGPPTAFGDAVKGSFGFARLNDYVAYLYDTPSPFRRLGELLPLVAKTARAGDPQMVEIFRRGGEILARQMISLMRLHPDMEPHITACGGAWKAHPAMAEAFAETVTAALPEATFVLPCFEHIMAGPVCLSMERGDDKTMITKRLRENFSAFVWNQI